MREGGRACEEPGDRSNTRDTAAIEIATLEERLEQAEKRCVRLEAVLKLANRSNRSLQAALDRARREVVNMKMSAE